MKIEFANRPAAIAMVPSSFDPEPIRGGAWVAWRDRGSGLEFHWENYDRQATPNEWHLRVYASGSPRVGLGAFKFHKESTTFEHDRVNFHYRLSKDEFDRSVTDREPHSAVAVAAIGGRDRLLDLCLHGARICHFRPLVMEESFVRVHPEADRIDFEILP